MQAQTETLHVKRLKALNAQLTGPEVVSAHPELKSTKEHIRWGLLFRIQGSGLGFRV